MTPVVMTFYDPTTLINSITAVILALSTLIAALASVLAAWHAYRLRMTAATKEQLAVTTAVARNAVDKVQTIELRIDGRLSQLLEAKDELVKAAIEKADSAHAVGVAVGVAEQKAADAIAVTTISSSENIFPPGYPGAAR
jgi:hypothetical protein